MPDLDSELEAMVLANSIPARRCSVAHVLAQMTEEQAKRLQTILEAGIVPASKIAALLRRNGYMINEKSISRHRRRKIGAGCTCP